MERLNFDDWNFNNLGRSEEEKKDLMKSAKRDINRALKAIKEAKHTNANDGYIHETFHQDVARYLSDAWSTADVLGDTALKHRIMKIEKDNVVILNYGGYEGWHTSMEQIG